MKYLVRKDHKELKKNSIKIIDDVRAKRLLELGIITKFTKKITKKSK